MKADAVPLEQVLDASVAALQRYLVLPEHASEAIALWIAHTYVAPAFHFTPRLVLTSAVMRCGKTTTLSMIHSLACKPRSASSASAASIFRLMELEHPTLLMDEAEGWFLGDQLLNTIVNAGFCRTTSNVMRVDTETFQPVEFDTFGPLAIALIGEPQATVLDRSVVVSLRRKRVEDDVRRFRHKAVMEEGEPIRHLFATWARDSLGALEAAVPELPDGLDDRAADLWEPLLAIADMAGDGWAKRARQAAIALSAHRLQSDPDIRTRLLEDIRSVLSTFAGNRIASRDLLRRLVSIEASPWSDWKRGASLTSRGLADLLRPFGIKPANVRIGEATPKGYKREDMERLFDLYLDPPDEADTAPTSD